LILFKILLFCLLLLTCSLFSAEKNDYLLCIHGFMGSHWNMRFLEKNLRKEGWDVINWTYPSRECYISEHAEQLVQDLIDLAAKKPGQPIHFVTHSMGALVLLASLNQPLCPQEAKIGKVILIAPPSQGTYWGRWIGQFSLARWAAKGFSGQELMTKSSFNDLGNYPHSLEGVLVISGSLGFNPLLAGKNDGTVSVQETLLSTPHEHVLIRRGHKTIVFSKKTYGVIRQFLEKRKEN
jgi:pimeloyl-ACP methyl ester carboxylesterase